MAICLNQLLNTLPKSNLRILIKQCKLIQLFYGEVIIESDENIKHVFFPLDCVFSLFDDDAKKITSIESKSAVGTEICLNENFSKTTAIVTQTGWAYKIDKASFLTAFNSALQCLPELMNYAHNFSLQIAIDEQEKRRIQLGYDILSLGQAVVKESVIRNNLREKYKMRERSIAA